VLLTFVASRKSKQTAKFVGVPQRLKPIELPAVNVTAEAVTHKDSQQKHRALPGNANLPIGGLRNAIQENGVPGKSPELTKVKCRE
jgi:hypothetical protein